MITAVIYNIQSLKKSCNEYKHLPEEIIFAVDIWSPDETFLCQPLPADSAFQALWMPVFVKYLVDEPV